MAYIKDKALKMPDLEGILDTVSLMIFITTSGTSTNPIV